MEKKYSVKILLKNLVDCLDIIEESVIIVKSKNIDEIKEQVELYVERLNANSRDSKIFELISILDYFEIKENIQIDDSFVDVYSRYLNKEELEIYGI
ncbi:hypothetical protein [Miniphocaeibacter massiliensis]|uniref:hypothetical protein n=1 Tax=Miniphocaeibacter massiliensis TaxID=2041841 RepID=UPI000C1C4D7E|nr:hypothetical protein [Miniphocaeibacter massiliensis]